MVPSNKVGRQVGGLGGSGDKFRIKHTEFHVLMVYL